jgi:SSS family solute:Na+ symporter
VLASRVATAILMALSLVVMAFLDSVEEGWKLLLALGAGTGLVLILRWYWWRVNAWSEISALAASFVTSVTLQTMGLGLGDTASTDYAKTMLITVAVTTVVWLTVTLLTPPESPATLERFYRRVRPGGAGWRPVSQRLGFGADEIPGGALSWVNWVAGVVAVYAAVFAVGAVLTGWPWRGAAYGLVSTAAFSLIYRNLRADPTLGADVDRAESTSLG